MSEICIYVKLPTYIKQWFVNLHGGEPVHLARGSAESEIVKRFITKLPENTMPQVREEGDTAICIPTYKNGPDPRYYNYMPRAPMKLLVSTINTTFRIQLHRELSCFFCKPNVELQDLIYSWMEQNGIEATETNWCAVSKVYQRMRESYKRNKRRLNQKAAQRANKCHKNHSDFRE